MSCSFDSGEAKQPLPFAMDEQSFRQWIEKLDPIENSNKLQLIASVLLTLSQIKLPAKLRYSFLKQLSSQLNTLCDQLQEPYLHSRFPFSDQHQSQIEYTTQAYSNIANNIAILCEDAEFKNENIFHQPHKALSLYLGMESQAKVLFFQALNYKKPNKNYWNLCYLFFLFSKQHNVLNFPIAKNDQSIINTFKKILVFELSNTQQFNAEEISTTFQVLAKYSNQIDLLTTVPEKKYRGLPFFNLRKNHPPALSSDGIYPENPFILYISCLKLIKQLFHILTKKINTSQYNKTMLLRLIKTLTMNQQRNGEREATKDEIFSIIGFDAVTKFLLSEQIKPFHNPLTLIDQPDFDAGINLPAEKRSNNSRSELDANLAAIPTFGGIEHLENDVIWLSKKDKQPNNNAANAVLIDQSSSGYRLSFKDNNETVEVGDIIGLMVSHHLIITIIRRIISSPDNEIHIGVEKLGSQPKLLSLTNSNDVIHLESSDHIESIVLKSSHFENENYFSIKSSTQVKQYKVEKQLHSSSVIRHIQVSLSQ